MTLQDWASAAIQCAFYSTIGFVAIISLFWSWWRTQLGWTITLKSLAIAAATLPSMLGIWFGAAYLQQHLHIEVIAIVALFCVPLILAWRALVLFRIQRAGVIEDAETAVRRQQPPIA